MGFGVVMQSGKLREIITIQSHDVGTDNYGQSVSTYTDKYTTRASIRIASSDERTTNSIGQELASVRYKIRIRYRATLPSVTDRILWVNSVLDITAVYDPDGKNAEIVLEATEHQTQD